MNSASFEGLKLYLFVPKALVWVTFEDTPNRLVVEVEDGGCPKTDVPNSAEVVVEPEGCPNCGAASCCFPNPLDWFPKVVAC